MPDTPTTRLGLYKSASDGSEDVDYTQDIGDNLDKIDLAVGALACTSSTRPSAPWNGQLIRETDTDRLWVSNGSSPASGSWSEICTPGTTQLFTDGIGAIGSATTTVTIATYVNNDTANRYAIHADGKQEWGSGSATLDTNLYRSAVNTLKTDDSFIVGTNLTVAGSGATTGNLTVGANLAVTGDTTIGGNLTVTGIGGLISARKTADTGRTSTTKTADPHLSVTLAADAVYALEAALFVETTDNGADIAVQWSPPGTSTATWTFFGQASTATSGTGSLVTQAFTNSSVGLGAISNATLTILSAGLVRTDSSGGTFALTWGMSGSGGTATLATDSYMVLKRIA